MKRTVIGILAHVDAGKTTLSEAMLYLSGSIRTMGRVDHGDAFLDTFSLERQRGITIFSKQAVLTVPGFQGTLLDTPGHVDFSAEMERTLDVLDAAILVISGTAGIQSHTITVWRLLRQKKIPTFIFVNKTDLPGLTKQELFRDLRISLGEGFADFSQKNHEEIAMCHEDLLEEFLETGEVSENSITTAIREGKLYPCWFGSALKLEGVEEFLEGLMTYTPEASDSGTFGAKVYKISRDDQNVRLTHLKVTGGVLKVRDTLSGPEWEEKATQLRVYSGSKFKAVDAAYPGDIVAVTGLTRTAPGLGLGAEVQGNGPQLEPVLTYGVILPEGYDIHKALTAFRTLEEEEPSLHVEFDAHHQEIRVQLMGKIQLEILKELMESRFNLDVSFSQGSILYKETILDTVEGVGHYEPLKHYAEVHLILEPAERGSGMTFATTCSENELDRNWQRLILTHLTEKQHLGVLTGSPITDMTITLVAGKAHLKHTEGGDFRQATYRAIRQGLMQAESQLLELWYSFRLEVPQGNVGRAMTDLQRMGAEMEPPETIGEFALLVGSAPVAQMQDYPTEVAAYTHGLGRFSCSFKGYAPCQEQDKIVSELGYEPEADLDNTPDSVFCSHGAGHTVKWYEVFDQMHLPSVLKPEEEEEAEVLARRYCAMVATDKELMAIFERTYGPIKQDKIQALRKPASSAPAKPYKAAAQKKGPEYLLVDGYNIIFAWEKLKKVAQENLDTARDMLINMLRNFQGFKQSPLILVFDAYKVKGNPGSIERYGDFAVVYTKEAETADMYIEKVTYELGKKHRVRVATSDGLEQMIILGHGALRVSARSFQMEVEEAEKQIRSFLM